MGTRGDASPDAVHHPLFARFYARFSVAADQSAGIVAIRAELLAALSGRVIEIGAGNGLNFPHYPTSVSEVVALEPERSLRALAVRAADGAGVTVEVVPGVAEALPVENASFDAAVMSLVLCSVRDVPRALSEVRRVLRPGGELRFFEHGLARTPGAARVQRVLDRTVWPHLFGGCHTSRDTVAALEEAGFHDIRYERFRLPERGLAAPTSPCVRGVAHNP
ncbi:methyltransferase domain-containing protein [Streptomyces sp. NPDC059076]|uniref:class I SAM-dependent methyltransferase n=1 Tax=unclassified Streptomyces TaxID=2593676 RepID=UPI00367A1B4B